jgi:hypothetical protein
MTGELANAICCRSTSLPTRMSEAHGHFVQVVGRRAVRQVQSKSGISRCRCSAPRHRRRHRPGGPEYRHLAPDGHPVLERSPRLPARTRPGQAGSPPGPTGSHPGRPRSPALRHPQRQHSIREPPRLRLLVPEIDVSTLASSLFGRELANRRRPAEDTVRLRCQAGARALMCQLRSPRLSLAMAWSWSLAARRYTTELSGSGTGTGR